MKKEQSSRSRGEAGERQSVPEPGLTEYLQNLYGTNPFIEGKEKDLVQPEEENSTTQ